MSVIKKWILKIYVNIKFIIKFWKTENSLSLNEAQKILHKFYPKRNIALAQNVNYEPKYDLMIIVPVYNAERFLESCISSLLGQQTQYSYYIVFVDDGSTDKSAMILDKYSQCNNIKIIHQQNMGISAARNIALKNICGNYLMFVDSDDILPDNTIETLMNLAEEKNADIVEGQYKSFISDDEIDIHKHERFQSSNLTKLNGYAWGKIISSEKLLNLAFPKGYEYEDTIISTLLIPSCKKIYVTNDVTYYYRKNEQGITSALYNRKSSIDTLYITLYCFAEALNRNYKISVEDYLKQVRLNWIRTKNMPHDVRKAIFIVEVDFFEKNYKIDKTIKKSNLLKLQKTLQKHSYLGFKWIMNYWEILG